MANFHWPLVAVILIIGVLGVYNLHSAAAARDPDLYLTQILWFAAGLVVAIGLIVPDYRVTESIAYVVYVIVCLLLLAVLPTTISSCVVYSFLSSSLICTPSV